MKDLILTPPVYTDATSHFLAVLQQIQAMSSEIVTIEQAKYVLSESFSIFTVDTKLEMAAYLTPIDHHFYSILVHLQWILSPQTTIDQAIDGLAAFFAELVDLTNLEDAIQTVTAQIISDQYTRRRRGGNVA